jgi:lipopolysaccharide/colanic/teichoic acid biosynthesis glycosyltransferase/glycosyltransferase involved in cell wall biosynthesis
MPVYDDAALPSVTLIMPAHNEAAFIAGKLRNLAALDYPRAKLHVVVACDGCTDDTVALARAALATPACAGLNAEIRDLSRNSGKVAVLNRMAAVARTEILAFTDVSAMLPPDALRRAAAWFADPALGAVGGTYALERPGSAGEEKYWSLQTAVKRGEAALGAPLGLHGAFWACRRAAWSPLPADTINDDFVAPMTMHLAGWRIGYDGAIRVREAERSDQAMESRRRRRIAAGNAQQLARLWMLLLPRHRGVALAFASGKALRVAMPFLIGVAMLGMLGLADRVGQLAPVAAAMAAGIGLVLLGGAQGRNVPRALAMAHYCLAGHARSMAGVLRYAGGRQRGAWARASVADSAVQSHVPRAVAVAKRSFDVTVALAALLLTLPFWPLIALAIRLDSPGPVVFRQLRVGRALADRTELFMMLKFRSMRVDAEAGGAVWATRRDPRVTRVGRFLRRTRLDELPQLINVLRGDMAIIGPRPERPGFYGRLDRAIPFFADRTLGLRPGITGLAQVRQGYDTSIADVVRKVAFDHAYAMRLGGIRGWLAADLGIAGRTLFVMAGARGQ